MFQDGGSVSAASLCIVVPIVECDYEGTVIFGHCFVVRVSFLVFAIVRWGRERERERESWLLYFNAF